MGRLTDLVIVVPGIGGSVLENERGQVVWGRTAAGTAQTVLRHTERLNIGERLRPTGVLPTLGVLPWMKVPGYDTLEKRLRAVYRLGDADVDISRPDRPGKLSARLVFFPYDFRQESHLAAARLAWDVDRRLKALGNGARVIMVGHSMGGIVARWWWGALGGHKICRKLITVGTPHRGAPKALDWLVNGVSLGGWPTSAPSRTFLAEATGVLREWPAIYELLPRYPAIMENGVQRYPHELQAATAEFRARSQKAYGGHLELERNCTPLAGLHPETGPDLLAFYSRGHATPSRAVVTNRLLRVTKEDPEWLPNQGWLGDGTVPAISAIPIEHSGGERADNYRRFAPESHVQMASSSLLIEHLEALTSDALSSVRGDLFGTPWLGFDLDDVIEVGRAATIGVRINGNKGKDAAPRLSLLRPGEVAFEAPIDMTRNGDGWSAAVTPTREGTYGVKVQVDNLEATDRVSGYEAFGAYAL